VQAVRVALVVGALAAWQAASDRLVPAFFISSPDAIWTRLSGWISSGFLWTHLAITMQEMIAGLIVGALAGIGVGFVLGSNRFLGLLLDPIITAIYSLPKVALAPLFVLWFGIGIEMKIVLTATIVFFLVFWNVYAGVRDVNQELVDVLRVMGAKRRDIALKVVLPGSFSWIYIGLKLAVPYSLIGAVFGELISSNRGIGYVLSSSAGQFDTAGIFATLVVLMFIATLMNEVLNRMETRVLAWKRPSRS
jgi:NitT/TauT family transport system permease protein